MPRAEAMDLIDIGDTSPYKRRHEQQQNTVSMRPMKLDLSYSDTLF